MRSAAPSGFVNLGRSGWKSKGRPFSRPRALGAGVVAPRRARLRLEPRFHDVKRGGDERGCAAGGCAHSHLLEE